MAHAVQVAHKGSYLHVIVTGDNTPRDVSEYLGEVRDACMAHRCAEVLIEENLRGRGIGILAAYEIVSERGAPAVASGLRRIAYVDANPEHDRTTLQFAETVARNRGLIVKLCTSVAEAERWLLRETDSAT